MGEVLHARGPQVLQVQDCLSIRPSGGGVFALVNDRGRMIGRKRGEKAVQHAFAFHPAKGAAKVRVAGVDNSTSELFGEVAGYGGVFGADFGVAAPGERDRLVGGSSGPVAGETPDCGPEPLDVGLMRDGGDEGPPSCTGGGFS